MKKKLPKYEIGRNAPCLCGSGKKYKRCCQILVEERRKNPKNSTDFFKTANTFFKKGEFEEAERFFRASLTQYIIWYHEHTVPFRKDDPKAAEDLFFIDIEAINEIADSVVKTLYNQKKIDNIQLLYSSLRDIIDHPRYLFYMDCQQAYWLDYSNKKYEAEEIFSRYGDEETVAFSPTSIGERSLDIYLRFTYLKLPALKSLAIIEKALADDFKVSFKLFLLTYKMRIAFLHNDMDIAKKTAKRIVQDLEKINEPDVLQNITIRTLLPDAYEMLAIVLQNSGYLNKLIDVCKKNLQIDQQDGFFSAAQNHLIAQAYMSLGELENAKKYLHKALSLNKRCEFQLDLAQINLRLNNQSEAILTLNDINYEKLPEGLKIDYLSCRTDVVLTNKDRKQAIETEKLLAQIKTNIPYFQTLTGCCPKGVSHLICKCEFRIVNYIFPTEDN